MTFYNWAIRPLLFRVDPERIHHLTMLTSARFGRSAGIRSALANLYAPDDPRLRVSLAGLDFSSPIGLGAGFDKNGEAAAVTSRLGFGFVEVGSVSEMPSPGNEARPRLWRLTEDEALRVHYGCPSDGAYVVFARLRAQKFPVPLGINLVETNTGTPTSAEHAAEELGRTIGRFLDVADYIALNLSCPNIPRGAGGLFDEASQLGNLLRVCARHSNLPPVFLKITPPGAPDDPRFIDSVLEAVAPFAFVKGFILNIPNRQPYETLRTPRAALDATRGGITGPSLFEPTKMALRAWYARIDRSQHILIGVGGIRSAEDAYEFMMSGASLVQVYTALIYQGPGLSARLNRGLVRLMERDGLTNIAQAIGAHARP